MSPHEFDVRFDVQYEAMFARTMALRRGFGYLFAFALSASGVSAIALLLPYGRDLVAILGCCVAPLLCANALVMVLCSLGCLMQSVETFSEARDLGGAFWCGQIALLLAITAACLLGADPSPIKAVASKASGFAAFLAFALFLMFFSCYLYRCGNNVGLPWMSRIWFTAAIVGILLLTAAGIQGQVQFRLAPGMTTHDPFVAGTSQAYGLFFPPLCAVYFGNVWDRLARQLGPSNPAPPWPERSGEPRMDTRISRFTPW